MRCSVCGTPNADNAAHCGSCGRALRTPTDKVHALTPVVGGPQTVPLRPSLAPQLTEGGQQRAGSDHAVDEDRFRAGTVVLSHYTIERQLGRGGMGAVYLAVDDVSGQRVAVKVLPSWLARDRDLRDRFVLEARALAALDHPGIVSLITFASEGDDRFLVMKYVAGDVLENRVRAASVLEPDEAVRILRAMCDALASAHDKGVVHRDIKPTNVLIDPAGKVVIVDFGIARNNDGNKRLTETGMLMGTPQYMSPEQIGGRTVDGRADLYACGLVFFEMLTGRPPFDGEHTFDVLRAQVDAPVPDLNAARRARAVDAVEVPQRFVDLCLLLLEKDPDDRPASGHDVVAMLDGATAVPTRSLSSSSSSLSVSSSWASLGPIKKTSSTPALAFADDNPDDDLAAVRRSPWRTPLWLLATAGFGVGLFFTVNALDAASRDDVVDVADAGLDTRFDLAALQARARLALEQHRLDDARVAVDTALLLGNGDELIEPLLLRTEVMIAGNNTVEAAATLRRLPTTLTPPQQVRRDALTAQLGSDDKQPKSTTKPAKQPKTAAPKTEASKPEAPKTEAPKTEAPKTEAPKPEASKPEAPKTEAPKTEAPKPEAPKTEAPKTQAPTTETPKTEAPPRPSTLPDDDFDTAIRPSRAEVSFCYAEHVLSGEDAAVGSMTLKATIAADGTVRRVVIDRSDFDNAAFSACVIKAVGEWRFPPFSGAEDVVTHVFNFKPRGS